MLHKHTVNDEQILFDLRKKIKVKVKVKVKVRVRVGIMFRVRVRVRVSYHLIPILNNKSRILVIQIRMS